MAMDRRRRVGKQITINAYLAWRMKTPCSRKILETASVAALKQDVAAAAASLRTTGVHLCRTNESVSAAMKTALQVPAPHLDEARCWGSHRPVNGRRLFACVLQRFGDDCVEALRLASYTQASRRAGLHLRQGRRNGGTPLDHRLDCLIVGGGPAGLTAALYLARFGRRALLVDAGHSRASWIPTSHNVPLFAEGISGPDILARQREHVQRYGGKIMSGTVTGIDRVTGGFEARIETDKGHQSLSARRMLLATGAMDVEPDLPDLPDAVRRGLVRYCPICDGYEARDRRIAVLGHGTRGLGEAIFVARTYSRDVTLMTLGNAMSLGEAEQEQIAKHGIRVIEDPVTTLDIADGRIVALRTKAGEEHRFQVMYSALGLKLRSELALALGAQHDDTGALLVDDHNRTTVPGLYAAGGVVRGLDQIVVAMGHAAVAATDIHNRCELPTEDEAGNPARSPA